LSAEVDANGLVDSCPLAGPSKIKQVPAPAGVLEVRQVTADIEAGKTSVTP
jgi:hypothetical protein